MPSQVRTILWAQLRTLRAFHPRRNRARLVVSAVMSTIWYGLWAAAAVAAGVILAGVTDQERLWLLLGQGLMISLLYWQVIPVLMVSTGASLDLKRLLVYPIPAHRLFGLEVLLRLSTGVEMILVLIGASAGLMANPALPFWAPAGFLPFILLNLFVAAGVRNVLERLLARKYVREVGFLLLVMAAALPQILLLGGVPGSFRSLAQSPPAWWWPWSATASVVCGTAGVVSWAVLGGWVALAFGFGRWQFERSLRWDREAGEVRKPRRPARESRRARVLSLPSAVLADPLGALVEKELRTLSRSPRFRLLFLMGFSFGLILWLPIAFRSGSGGTSILAANYLTFVSVYALLLLGEVIWNSFGFDRAAAQLYLLTPVPAGKVLLGKNIAGTIFVFLEVTAVAAVCAILRMPISPIKLAECYAVTLVLTLYILAAGNQGSTRYARGVDPRRPWRSTSTGRFQAMLLLVYPVIAIPVVLAFLLRYAFGSTLAFWGVLAAAAAGGGAVYRLSLNSAAAVIEGRPEQLISSLSAREGPISA